MKVMFDHIKRTHGLPPALLALSLTACGGDGTSPQSGGVNDDATVTYAGLLFLEPEFEFGDGEARIPEAIAAELNADFSSTTYRFRRESYFEYVSGDVYLFVGNTSAADR